jgi:hypothetical protein
VREEKKKAILRDILEDMLPLRDILSQDNDLEKMFEDIIFKAELEKRLGKKISKEEWKKIIEDLRK